MTIALKVNLTDKEKKILLEARELTDTLGDDIRSAIDCTVGLESDIIDEMYSQADSCDEAWSRLNDLCDEFGID